MSLHVALVVQLSNVNTFFQMCVFYVHIKYFRFLIRPANYEFFKLIFP